MTRDNSEYQREAHRNTYLRAFDKRTSQPGTVTRKSCLQQDLIVAIIQGSARCVSGTQTNCTGGAVPPSAQVEILSLLKDHAFDVAFVLLFRTKLRASFYY
jgi:hypothetical protein